MYSSRAAIERTNYYSDNRVINSMAKKYSYLKKNSSFEVDFDWLYEHWSESYLCDGDYMEFEEFKGSDSNPDHELNFLFESEPYISGNYSYYNLKDDYHNHVGIFLFWLSRSFSDFDNLKEKTIFELIEIAKSEDFDWPVIKFSTKFEICPTCEGRGSHVNPSIDCGGISQSEWQEWDWEDRDDYMSGRYDVVCYECKGKRVIETLDASGSSTKFKAYLDNMVCYMNEASYYDALERANELRFGC